MTQQATNIYIGYFFNPETMRWQYLDRIEASNEAEAQEYAAAIRDEELEENLHVTVVLVGQPCPTHIPD